jgi:thiol-disulfide isomerase/thioredoxin
MRFAVCSFLLLLGGVVDAQPPSGARIIKLPELKDLIHTPSDKIQVINFWATWCAPCVKELPLFEKLSREREDVKVTLVSLDLDLDPNPEKVYRFIARKKIQCDVLILDAKDPNTYIDQVDKRWSGAIPATLIINSRTGKRKFIEKELHEGELEQFLAEIQ